MHVWSSSVVLLVNAQRRNENVQLPQESDYRKNLNDCDYT